MTRVVVEAGNVRSGGGAQVAASFLDELAALRVDVPARERYPWLDQVRVVASPEVVGNLGPGVVDRLAVTERRRRPTSPSDVLRVGEPRDPAVEFVVFGPSYARRSAAQQVVGFADVTSLYGAPPGVPEKPLAALRRRIRTAVSLRLFRGADLIVVETDAVADRLRARLGTGAPPVTVVPNAPHRLFAEAAAGAQTRSRLLTGRRPDDPVLLYPARGYPHKNHDVLPRLAQALSDRHAITPRFRVTLTDAEWAARSPEFRAVVENLGPLSLAELAVQYGECDGVIFPSLLECFSATPLEALTLGLPLFASDRDFVHTTCGDAATYLDPLDPEAAAATIAAAMDDPAVLRARTEAGRRAAADLPTARERALAYLDLIDARMAAATGRR